MGQREGTYSACIIRPVMIQLMKKNCFMASIDLADAYYTVPMAVEQKICTISLEKLVVSTHVST